MTRRPIRWGLGGILGLGLVALTGCTTLIAPSGVWYRVVDGQLEVSPCRDLVIERIGLEASLTDGGNATAEWRGEAVSVSVGETISIPPPGWDGDGLDFAITDDGVWDRIGVTLAGPAGDHRSNMYGVSETWTYGATGGMFLADADECDAPAE